VLSKNGLFWLEWLLLRLFFLCREGNLVSAWISIDWLKPTSHGRNNHIITYAVQFVDVNSSSPVLLPFCTQSNVAASVLLLYSLPSDVPREFYLCVTIDRSRVRLLHVPPAPRTAATFSTIARAALSHSLYRPHASM